MIIVAIDGTCCSGKGSVAQVAAKLAGMTYVDSGKLYRAVAFYCLENGIDINDERVVTAALPDIGLKYENRRAFLNGRAVTDLVAAREYGNASSVTGEYGAVRDHVNPVYRAVTTDAGITKGIVMEGRDITSVVFPNADVKIYMDAHIDIRSKRRREQYLTRDKKDVPFETVKAEMEERDYRDKNRPIAPLIRVDDAFYLDTGVIDSIEQEINIVLGLIERAESGRK